MMTCDRRGGIVLVVLAMAIARPARAEITAAQVKESIADGVKFLFKQQHPAGRWTEHDSEPGGGMSALCTLALLNSGVAKDDPAAVKALDYLERIDDPGRTYSASLIVMALCQADPVKYKAQINRWPGGSNPGRFAKGATTPKEAGATTAKAQADNSQHAVRHARPARGRAGWRESQRSDLAARPELLDAAGNAAPQRRLRLSLRRRGAGRAADGQHDVRRHCLADHRRRPLAGRRCDGRGRPASNAAALSPLDTPLDGRDELDGQSFQRQRQSGQRSGLATVLPICRRARRADVGPALSSAGTTGIAKGPRCSSSGRRTRCDGSWIGVNHIEKEPLIGTSLALLFLSKGRRPVVIAKLKHGDDPRFNSYDWDHHRRAVQNLTWRIEKQWRKDLSWQTIDAKNATAADLLEAPVPVHQRGRWSARSLAEQRQNLKDYIEQGGFLFAEACDGNGCNGAAFDADFRALMRELFPAASSASCRRTMRSGSRRRRSIPSTCRTTRNSGCGASTPAAGRASSIARGACRATGSWPIRIARARCRWS